ncbi:uncharacterized protein LOC134273919 [Saccostrea cucullata]|uniref:uncharacterized protein LOC134273919 n=1 Tax=Saccostrea cuccullata TaxID=36930 RepID=UPI002ED29B59
MLSRWRDYFEEVLNRDTPESTPQDEHEEEEEKDISVDPPTTQEIRTALKTFRNGRAPGADQITAEMLKADIDKISQELKHAFDQIWKEEKVPKEWTRGLICKIQREERAGRFPERERDCQPDLHPQEHPGTSQRVECYTVHPFLDFEKAFDSVHKDSIWVIMKKYGIPRKLITMVKALHDNFQCSVIDDNETTDPFPVVTGVKQGCRRSGFLFLLVIDWVMQQTVRKKRTGIR